MQLTILGNNGPYPETGGACSGYLICDDARKTRILIDCGTGVLANLRKYVLPRDLDAVILTHLHYDHMSDMLPMIYALQFAPRDMPLPVYLPDSPENVRALLNVPAYDLRLMDAFQIGDMRISFAPMRHPVETRGVRIECDGRTFVFTGDTNETDSIDALAQGCDLLMMGAGLSRDDWHENAPHLSAERCARHAAALHTRLLITHLNPKYDPAALLAEAQNSARQSPYSICSTIESSFAESAKIPAVGCRTFMETFSES